MDEPQSTIEGPSLISKAAGLQWFEAVAVVLQITDALRKTGDTSPPDLLHVRIDTNGTVSIQPGSPYYERPVPELASMLRVLLEQTSAPPELGQLVADGVSGQLADKAVNDFAKSLQYFERPFRQEILKRVVDRVSSVEAEARSKEELERLEARARDAAAAPLAAKKKEAPPEKRRQRAMLIAVGVVVIVLVAGSAVAWWLFRPTITSAGIRVGSAVSQARARIAQAVDKAVGRLSGSAQPEKPGEVATPAPSPVKRTARLHERKDQPPELAAQRTEKTGSPATRSDSPSSPAATAVPPEEPLPLDEIVTVNPPSPEPDPDRSRVYSSLDSDVTPPVPLQPIIGVPGERRIGEVGQMELVIDEMGNVERVQLFVPNRYQDRMLVFAVKARKFRPAIRDGHFVKYLLRIRAGV